MKSTRYINGKESSKVCHIDLSSSEFLTGCSGLVHLHEHLFTDITFHTNKNKYDFRSAMSSNTGGTSVSRSERQARRVKLREKPFMGSNVNPAAIALKQA